MKEANATTQNDSIARLQKVGNAMKLGQAIAEIDASLLDGVVFTKPDSGDKTAKLAVTFERVVYDDAGKVVRDWSQTIDRLERLGNIMRDQKSTAQMFGSRNNRPNGQRIAIHSALVLLERKFKEMGLIK